MNKNKTIIITGAGSGIGKSTAEYFLKNNYCVALLGRNKKKLEQASNSSKNALVIPCDISNFESVEDAFDKVFSEWGYINVLFNNAGIGTNSKTIDEISISEWKEVVDINLSGSFYCARSAFKIMKNQTPQGGRIINNGSISAHVPRPGSSPYTSTKHAITGLTKSISLDGRPFNIVSCQIDIGNAATEMTKKMSVGVPQANGSIKAEPTMEVTNVSKSIFYMAELPLNANVQFMTVMASSMPYIGRG